MGKIEEIFGRIKPTEEEKTAFKREFEINLLTAALFMGRISPNQYLQRWIEFQNSAQNQPPFNSKLGRLI